MDVYDKAMQEALKDTERHRARAEALEEQVKDLQSERDKLLNIIKSHSEARPGIFWKIFGR